MYTSGGCLNYERQQCIGTYSTKYFYEWDDASCACNETQTSPIIIDVDGDNVLLTAPDSGTYFDIDGDGRAELTAWTETGANDRFLCLDRNGNNTIDNAIELFGSHTPQNPSNQPNGFAALAEFDTAIAGGNGDGKIDKLDAIYSHLLLWRDANHDGKSQPSELASLEAAGVVSISLDYALAERKDRYGNVFHYRSKVLRSDGREVWAHDVFLKYMP